MKPQSAKAKGRKAQQKAANAMTAVLDLPETDVVSRPMGSPGGDFIMSDRARRAISPLDGVEVKAHERLNLWAAWKQAREHSKNPVLILTKNREETLAVVPYPLLLELLFERNMLRDQVYQAAG